MARMDIKQKMVAAAFTLLAGAAGTLSAQVWDGSRAGAAAAEKTSDHETRLRAHEARMQALEVAQARVAIAMEMIAKTLERLESKQDDGARRQRKEDP